MSEIIKIKNSTKSTKLNTFAIVILNDNGEEEIVRDFLNNHQLAVDCANFVAKNENITTIIDETDDNHYREMKEFFIENLKNLEFRPYLPFCSCCGSDKPVYIGMIPNAIKTIVSFAFCVNCRDEMTLKKNALTCDV